MQLLIVAAINKADAEKARGARHYLHLGRKDTQKRHEIRHTKRGQRGEKRKKGHSGATYAGLMKADADKTPLDLQIATGNGVNSKKREQGRKGRCRRRKRRWRRGQRRWRRGQSRCKKEKGRGRVARERGGERDNQASVAHVRHV